MHPPETRHTRDHGHEIPALVTQEHNRLSGLVRHDVCNATLAAYLDAYQSSNVKAAIDLGMGNWPVYQLYSDSAAL